MSSDRLRTPEVEALLEAFGALKTADERYAFLQDVATIREIQDLAQRLAVARMLHAGEHYTNIQAVTGASSTTISRVSRCLNYGAEGYHTVIDRIGDPPSGSSVAPDRSAASDSPASAGSSRPSALSAPSANGDA